MDKGDIVVGQTYLVHLPRRSDAGPHLTDPAVLVWVLCGADDFDLTVTAVDAVLDGEPAVTGVRVAETSRVTTPLPRAAAYRLGLPADVDYLVTGAIVDAASGQVVRVPTEQRVTVPVGWLLPLR